MMKSRKKSSKQVIPNVEPSAPLQQQEKENDEEWQFDTLEQEIAYLRQENERLKTQLVQNRNKGPGFGEDEDEQNKGKQPEPDEKKIPDDDMSILESSFELMTPDEFSDQVQKRLPQMLKKVDEADQSNVIYFRPNDKRDQIGVIDMKNVDVWTVVDAEMHSKIEMLGGAVQQSSLFGHLTRFPEELVFADEDESALSGPFVYLHEEDIVDAVAYFVAQCVTRMPECQNLTHEEMLKKLDSTFAELREKGMFGKIWDWCNFGYSVYGWGSSAWGVYTNPWLAQLIMRGIWSVGTLVLLL